MPQLDKVTFCPIALSTGILFGLGYFGLQLIINNEIENLQN